MLVLQPWSFKSAYVIVTRSIILCYSDGHEEGKTRTSEMNNYVGKYIVRKKVTHMSEKTVSVFCLCVCLIYTCNKGKFSHMFMGNI